MTEITSTAHDDGYRTGRCGDWYIRARSKGATYDLAMPPFKRWEEARSEYMGLTLDQAARLLGIPRGDLYEWGCG